MLRLGRYSGGTAQDSHLTSFLIFRFDSRGKTLSGLLVALSRTHNGILHVLEAEVNSLSASFLQPAASVDSKSKYSGIFANILVNST